MSIARAIRYRRLALAQEDKATADLLLKLADECDQGILCTAEWRSARPRCGTPFRALSSSESSHPTSDGSLDDRHRAGLRADAGFCFLAEAEMKGAVPLAGGCRAQAVSKNAPSMAPSWSLQSWIGSRAMLTFAGPGKRRC